MGFKLKKEKNVWHNCNDERMIDWCIEHLIGHFGDHAGQYGFGCSCEETEDEKELEEFEKGFYIGVYHLYDDDERWQKWMSEISYGEIRVYFCGRCEEWAIDNDC